MLLLALAAAGAAAGLADVDRRLAEVARVEAEAQAPLVTLLVRLHRTALQPGGVDRAARLAKLGALVRLVAPGAQAASAHAAAERNRLAHARAALVLPAIARAAKVRRAVAPVVPPICPGAVWRLPPATLGMPPSLMARLDGLRGAGLLALPGASIAAPAGGRVAYAGHFRRYRGTVILDHGHGWTTLVTGLDRLAVRTDMRIEQGQALGQSGAAVPLLGMELSHHGRAVQPALLLERCFGPQRVAKPRSLAGGEPLHGA